MPDAGNGSHGNGRRPATLDRPVVQGVPDRAPGSAPLRRRPPGPSAKPAAIVFAIIFVVFAAGFVADELTSSHHPSAAPPHTATGPVPGTGGLVAQPAEHVLAPVVTADEPPPDILAALVVPKGTSSVPGSAQQQGVGLFDASVDAVVPAPQQDVITFVRKELDAGNWQLVSSGTSGNAYRIVAQHPGSDGYEWEVGFTMSPSTFSSPVPGVTVPAGGLTPVSLRLFAISDDS